MAYKRDAIINDDVGQLIREMETNYINGQTSQSEYVQFSMYEDLQRIDAYLNSKHISGATDSLGRDKPFFNIVTAAVNIWYRATDIDRKNIKVRATKSKDTVDAFLGTVFLQDWMRRERFGAFLNEWGRVLARYGSAVVKFVEKEGRLVPSVVPWQRLIVDAVDFDANWKVEILELTEGQIYDRVETHGYDKEMVEKLCDARKSRELVDGHNIDNKSDYIKLYEAHGYDRKSYLTGKEKDEDEFVQQMHVVSFVASKEKGDFDDFTLVSGREKKDPYMITHLIKEDGQTLSIGAVKHLFDAQWMVNHTIKNIKDQLDLSSKLIFQTSDGNFVGQNALQAVETGDILVHKPNEPLTHLANNANDVTALQNFQQLWMGIKNEITGISESMLGNAAPSGTAWRQVEALLQQNQSLFELMTENKGLAIDDMLRTYVIPFSKTKMDTSEEVSATLEAHDIDWIDAKYLKSWSIEESNRIIRQELLEGGTVTPEEQQMMIDSMQSSIKENLNGLGNQRFFKPSSISDKTWKEQFKDLEWELDIDITGESTTSKEDLATISTLIQTMSNPATAPFFQSPEGRFLKNKVLTLTGALSPLEIPSMPPPTPIQQPVATQ